MTAVEAGAGQSYRSIGGTIQNFKLFTDIHQTFLDRLFTHDERRTLRVKSSIIGRRNNHSLISAVMAPVDAGAGQSYHSMWENFNTSFFTDIQTKRSWAGFSHTTRGGHQELKINNRKTK